MIEAKNADQFFSQLDKWLEEVELFVTNVAKGIAYQALHRLAITSPQFSGDFASNWKISVGTPDTSFDIGAVRGVQASHGTGKFSKYPVFIAGSAPAVDYALSHAVGKLDDFKLGDSIFITSTAKHSDFYSYKIENNQIKFRDGNTGGTLMTTYSLLTERLSSMGQDMARRLAATKERSPLWV